MVVEAHAMHGVVLFSRDNQKALEDQPGDGPAGLRGGTG